MLCDLIVDEVIEWVKMDRPRANIISITDTEADMIRVCLDDGNEIVYLWPDGQIVTETSTK